MKLDNFLPVSRQLQKHWIYKDSSYLHGWLDMLFNARFSTEPKTDIYKGVLYTINRGEFLYSRPSYSQRLGITEGKLRTLIKLLISDGMIEEVKSLGNNKPTIYKIINYGSYNSQPSEHVGNTKVETHCDQLETKWEPSDNQVETSRQPLKNKDNKDKKENNKHSLADIELIVERIRKELPKDMAKTSKIAHDKLPKLIKQHGEDELINSVKNYIQQIKKDRVEFPKKNYMNESTFWNGRYLDFIKVETQTKQEPKKINVVIVEG